MKFICNGVELGHLEVGMREREALSTEGRKGKEEAGGSGQAQPSTCAPPEFPFYVSISPLPPPPTPMSHPPAAACGRKLTFTDHVVYAGHCAACLNAH